MLKRRFSNYNPQRYWQFPLRSIPRSLLRFSLIIDYKHLDRTSLSISSKCLLKLFGIQLFGGICETSKTWKRTSSLKKCVILMRSIESFYCEAFHIEFQRSSFSFGKYLCFFSSNEFELRIKWIHRRIGRNGFFAEIPAHLNSFHCLLAVWLKSNAAQNRTHRSIAARTTRHF